MSTQKKLVVCDSHPVQYRVPIWKLLEKLNPGHFHVVYASDCSVKGHSDKGFGQIVTWDEPLLDGYGNTVINCEKGVPLSGWGSLTGKGLYKVLGQSKPDVILLTGLNYKFDMVAYSYAIKKGIPIWLRCETQDEAVERSKFKGIVRGIIMKTIYKGIDKFFYIGELNKQHYLKHGVKTTQLIRAPYATVDRFSSLNTEKKNALRQERRLATGISDNALVIGFSGKLIPKKNPLILFEALTYLPAELRKRIHLYYLGSGELEDTLKIHAKLAFEEYGIKTSFSGFVNQLQLPSHYLAMDIMVLPSRKMGETWGLVTNEAMQSGSAVIVSSAVGSSKDFAEWDRFRVFNEGDAQELATRILDLSKFERDFDWAFDQLKTYSLDVVAESISTELKNF